MSAYPSDQRCPRCQYPVTPGAPTCANCGLALTGTQGAAPGSTPSNSLPPPQPASGAAYGTPPLADPYGGAANPGGAGTSDSQQPTLYSGAGLMNSAPTVASSLYPQDPGGQPDSKLQQGGYPPPPPSYPGYQPQGNFGSASAYPGSQPAYPGSQAQGSFPGAYSAPPLAPQMPPTQKKGNGAKIAIIALVILVILGGVGAAAYLLTRPKPIVTVASDYKVGSTPAGSTGTVFHFTGSNFSGNSAITFLLDGTPTPDAATAQSDSHGNVKADLKVTSGWTTGDHTLSAKDASGYSPQTSATVTIVAQGQANTPGPNGAPPDDTPSFTIKATVSPQDAVTGQQFQDFRDTLADTGQPDPAGGTVCDPQNDSGQPTTQAGTSNGIGFIVTAIFTCSGTYKGGALTYTEKATSYQVAFDNGVKCQANVPFVNQDLSGRFTDANTISGTYTSDAVTFMCSNGQSIQANPQKGTWTGTT